MGPSNAHSPWGVGYPRPQGERGRDRHARKLHLALLVSLAAFGLGIILDLALGSTTKEVPTLVFASLGLLAALQFNRRGHWAWSARIASLTILVTAVLLVAQARDGFRSIAMLIFPGVFVLSMLLLDGYYYALLSGATVILVTALGLAEIHGLIGSGLPVRTPTTYLTILDVDLILVLVATFGGLIARDVRKNSAEVRAAMGELAAANGQLQRSEERYRSLIDHAVDGIFITSDSGVILEANRQACQLAGLRPEQLAGKTLASFTAPAQDGEDVFPIERLNQGDPVVTVGRIHRADGAASHVELHSMKMPEGRIQCFCRDITERLASEQQVAHLQKMESVGRLAGGVAHDFNNLLTIINGYADLISTRLASSDPNRGDVELIKRAGHRAAHLTQQLLAFSRKEKGQVKPIDLNQAVAESEQMIGRLLGGDIEMASHLFPGPARVLADQGELQQVLVNLAVNARDAMPSGGKLTLATSLLHLTPLARELPHGLEPGAYFVVSMADTGTGMDPETRRRIFEPFFTTKETGRGTGLGLSIAHAIIHKLGGWITVESTPGQGSVFKIYLPELPASKSPGAPAATGEEPSARGAETILLVEDQEEVRLFAKRVLTGLGYQVLEASSGAEAMSLHNGHSGAIDLLLSDIAMPQMSGRQLAGLLARIRPEIRVLLMSGYAGLPAGTDSTDRYEFIQKPFSPAELARKVRAVLAAGPAASGRQLPA